MIGGRAALLGEPNLTLLRGNARIKIRIIKHMQRFLKQVVCHKLRPDQLISLSLLPSDTLPDGESAANNTEGFRTFAAGTQRSNP